MNRLKTLIAVQIFLAAPIAATAHNAEEHAREAAQNREGPHALRSRPRPRGQGRWIAARSSWKSRSLRRRPRRQSMPGLPVGDRAATHPGVHAGAQHARPG